MALDTGATGTYADVTGVINATAAGEVVALFDIFEGIIAPADGAEPSHPDWDAIPKHVAVHLLAELDELRAAIAAAPTA